jgi:hypothetical protein
MTVTARPLAGRFAFRTALILPHGVTHGTGARAISPPLANAPDSLKR